MLLEGVVSIGIGFLFSLLTSFLLKRQMQIVRQNFDNYELVMLTLCPFISFLVTEGIGFSGLLAILGSGIALGRFGIYNVSSETAEVLQSTISGLSYFCKIAVYILIGLHFAYLSDLKLKMVFSLGAYSLVTLLFMAGHYLKQRELKKVIMSNLDSCKGAVGYLVALRCDALYDSDLLDMFLIIAVFANLATVVIMSLVLKEDDYRAIEEVEMASDPDGVGFTRKVSEGINTLITKHLDPFFLKVEEVSPIKETVTIDDTNE